MVCNFNIILEKNQLHEFAAIFVAYFFLCIICLHLPKLLKKSSAFFLDPMYMHLQLTIYLKYYDAGRVAHWLYMPIFPSEVSGKTLVQTWVMQAATN